MENLTTLEDIRRVTSREGYIAYNNINGLSSEIVAKLISLYKGWPLVGPLMWGGGGPNVARQI